ncbi:MAG: primosomal protein N' [Flavobacteriaceae bacterium]|nr:primosomal protein N' [Flavobacteriaceae bacterium]
MNFFIDVIIPLPLSNAFTYSVSKEEFDFLDLGHRVGVPFGKNKLFTGIIIKKHKIHPEGYDPKSMESILDDVPIVTRTQLELWKWVSKYYLCSIGEVLKASMPSSLILSSESKITKIKNKIIDINSLSDDEYIIYEALQVRDLSIEEIKSLFDDKKVVFIVQTMIEKGLVKNHSHLVEKYKPKTNLYFRLCEKYITRKSLLKLIDQLSKSPKQKQILVSILNIDLELNSWIKDSVLKIKSGSSSSTFQTLIKKNILEKKYLIESRVTNKIHDNIITNKLSKIQSDALLQIKKSFLNNDVVLLKGVTSSGKTEIYMEMIQAKLDNNKQILYLLPEISLTTQMVRRLKDRFGSKVVVYHSKFNNNEKVDIWRQILNNKDNAKIILGARSSVLLPFKNLGLIIIDEEHENSFKQFDPSPRYHARDLAIYLGNLLNVKVILGSATPSVETFYNVKIGKYGLVKLLKRYGGVEMPEIRCIDLKEAYRKKNMNGFFSNELINEINKSLSNNKQVILFQNRRGYAPIIECVDCGHIPQCPNCDVALTFHQFNNQMKCHYCGYNISKLDKCLNCGGLDINHKGIGTQKIEEQINSLFPGVNVARMDWDSTRGKKSFDKIIDSFTEGKVKILIGTQMITKGLDFKNVSLVGVLNADSLMNFPDFRSHERSFQMISQVAGRAGRSKDRGEVIIQTFSPDHDLLKQIVENDYEGMFKNQIIEREIYKYPPYKRLIRITLKSKDYNKVYQGSNWMGNLLRQSFDKSVLGPVSPYVSRIRNQYNKQILIKYFENKNRRKTKKIISLAIKSFYSIASFKSIKISLDVDPY